MGIFRDKYGLEIEEASDELSLLERSEAVICERRREVRREPTLRQCFYQQF